MQRLALLALPLGLLIGCTPANSNSGAKPPVSATGASGGGDAAGAPAKVEGGKVALSGYNTSIKFVGTKPNGKHEGGFRNVTGTIQVSDTGAVTAINAEIDIESMYSDTEKLTTHLKSADFFEAKAHPKATFTSTKIDAAKDGEVNVTGDLTIHGVKKSISFPAKVTGGKGSLTLKADFKFNWRDFMKFEKAPIDPDVAVAVMVGN